MSHPDNTPILVGVGQQTWREPDPALTPIEALCEVACRALADSGCRQLAGAIDALATVRFIADTNPDMAALFPRNPGRQVASRLGIGNASLYQGTIGGNTPQYLINHFAARLARGEHGAVLISGAELLATLFDALGSGGDITAWPGEADSDPATVGKERDGLHEAEKPYGMYEPVNTYPLFENSLRHALGTELDQHQAYIAQICSAMSRVGADNPYAWNRAFLTPDEISTVSVKNRYIGYPYTRAMNPVLAVDMAAAVIMTTVAKARELGIEPERWIYLHGGLDVNDIWYVSQRPCLHESPAIRLAWKSLAQATVTTLDELTDFDIYSCFPSAVQIACREIGLSPLDSRGVTVTGGLPYMGGPGNNYSLHAVASMVDRLRQRGRGHGLVTANGLYLTKHSLGLYSTEPPQRQWQAIDSAEVQSRIDAAPLLSLAEDPSGNMTIESYTVGFGRQGPKLGLVIGMNERGQRIIANTGSDEQALAQLMSADPIGQQGVVRQENGVNLIAL